MPRSGCVRLLGAALALTPLIALDGCSVKGRGATEAPAVLPAPISMAALHQAGGVPPGWGFTPPPGDAIAGRQAFIDFGCFSCHAVQGEPFPAKPEALNHAGPD